MTSTLKVGVMGAGAVGCYVGARLVGAGADVVFVGRERLQREVEEHGICTKDLDGTVVTVPNDRVVFCADAARLEDRDVVLVCVKSAHTEDAAQRLAPVLRKGAIVVSLQNGVRNPDVLRTFLPEQIVLGGIVGFNVVSKGGGVFLRATTGPLVVERSETANARALAAAFDVSGFELEESTDIRALQWSKLVINLNNAVSALSGASTKEIILSAGYRRILAAIMAEGIVVLRAAKIRPARLGAIPVTLFPFVLRLPTPLLRVAARAQLKIDPDARSSMWADLSLGRPTEVDYLNGELARIAETCNARAPLNRRVVELVHEAENRGGGSPKMSAKELWSALVETSASGPP